MSKKKVVIIGGGFAGVNSAKKLQKKFEVILINKTKNFIFKPLLVEYVFGDVKEDNLKFELETILPYSKIIIDEVTNINYENNEIILKSNEKLNYDYLIISSGSTPNNFGMDISCTSTIYDLESANQTKQNFEEIKTKLKNNEQVSIGVVGGGPVGIEFITLASDFVKYFSKKYNNTQTHKLNVIDAAPQLFSHFGSNLQNHILKVLQEKNIEPITQAIGKQITKTQDNKIEIAYEKDNKKEQERYDVLLWAAGIKKINPNNEKLSPTSKLNLPIYNNVFTAGDCALIFSNDTKLAELAQTAEMEGKFVAQNILNKENNKPLIDMNYNLKGFDILLGHKKELVVIYIKHFKIMIGGFFARIINRIIYLKAMPSINIKIKLFVEWFFNLFSKKFKY